MRVSAMADVATVVTKMYHTSLRQKCTKSGTFSGTKMYQVSLRSIQHIYR